MSNIATAIRQLERERAHLKSQLASVTAAVALFRGPSGTGKTMARRRRMSAAGRARIRAAQRARWAKWRQSQKTRPGKKR